MQDTITSARDEIVWDLGPFAAMLLPGHTSPLAQNRKKLYGTKNNCMHVQLDQILDKRYKETKQPKCHF